MSDDHENEENQENSNETEKPGAVLKGNSGDMEKLVKSEDGDRKQSGKKPTGQILQFNKNIEIFCEQPLEKYSVGDIKAYVARDKGGDKRNLYALICEPHLLPRVNDASVYLRVNNPYLASLSEYGVRYWPLEDKECLILIYRDNVGDRLVQDDRNTALGWPQSQVLDYVVAPLVQALQEMHIRDFVHGGIRLSNLFKGNFEANEPKKLVLGDALATPSLFLQPPLYLTIERGMANPMGRGRGSQADDIYAFGVALACLLRSHDPLEGKTDREVISEKIEQGSYAAITGKDRFTGSILELLRGTLHDDPTQRWSVAEIVEWADGRRLSPKQAVKQIRSPRSLDFDGGKYFYKKTLAMDLENNLRETVRIYESDALEQWIVRSLQDEEVEQRFETFLAGFRDREGSKPNYEDRLVSYMSIVLDPSAPIRYKSHHLMGDGVGTALASAMLTHRDLNPFVEMLSNNIVTGWLGAQFQSTFDVGALVSRCDAARNALRRNEIGSGLERVVYSLSPDLHCLSGNVDGYIVYDSETLLAAFEKKCEEGKLPKRFIDRHCAAFLVERDNKVINTMLFEMSQPHEYKYIMADLRCLASIQYRYKTPKTPHLAKAFLDLLSVVLERYHDRDVRESVGKQLQKFADEGDLVKMANVLDNQDIKRRDIRAFRMALGEYKTLKLEHEELVGRLENRDAFVRGAGREVAAYFSIVLGGLVTLLVGFLYMVQTPSF